MSAMIFFLMMLMSWDLLYFLTVVNCCVTPAVPSLTITVSASARQQEEESKAVAAAQHSFDVTRAVAAIAAIVCIPSATSLSLVNLAALPVQLHAGCLRATQEHDDDDDDRSGGGGLLPRMGRENQYENPVGLKKLVPSAAQSSEMIDDMTSAVAGNLMLLGAAAVVQAVLICVAWARVGQRNKRDRQESAILQEGLLANFSLQKDDDDDDDDDHDDDDCDTLLFRQQLVLSAARCPSVLLLPALVLMQPTTAFSIVTLFYADLSAQYFIGAAGLLTVLLLKAYYLVQGTSTSTFLSFSTACRYAALTSTSSSGHDDLGEEGCLGVRSFFFGRGEWVAIDSNGSEKKDASCSSSIRGTLFLQQHWLMLCDYTGRCPYFLSIIMGMIIACGAAQAAHMILLNQQSLSLMSSCRIVASGLLGIFSLTLAVSVVKKPWRSSWLTFSSLVQYVAITGEAAVFWLDVFLLRSSAPRSEDKNCPKTSSSLASPVMMLLSLALGTVCYLIVLLQALSLVWRKASWLTTGPFRDALLSLWNPQSILVRERQKELAASTNDISLADRVAYPSMLPKNEKMAEDAKEPTQIKSMFNDERVRSSDDDDLLSLQLEEEDEKRDLPQPAVLDERCDDPSGLSISSSNKMSDDDLFFCALNGGALLGAPPLLSTSFADDTPEENSSVEHQHRDGDDDDDDAADDILLRITTPSTSNSRSSDPERAKETQREHFGIGDADESEYVEDEKWKAVDLSPVAVLAREMQRNMVNVSNSTRKSKRGCLVPFAHVKKAGKKPNFLDCGDEEREEVADESMTTGSSSMHADTEEALLVHFPAAGGGRPAMRLWGARPASRRRVTLRMDLNLITVVHDTHYSYARQGEAKENEEFEI